MRKLPKHYDVKGVRYTIHQVDELEDNDCLCDGFIDLIKKQIFIDKNQTQGNKKIAFIHELLHAVIEESCVTSGGLTEELEEVLVENIARFLCGAFYLRLK